MTRIDISNEAVQYIAENGNNATIRHSKKG